MPRKDRAERIAYQREYHKRWYQVHKADIHEARVRRRLEIHNWFRLYKDRLTCTTCGESHPACLQFHFRDKSEKSMNIANLANRASSLKALIREIDKCEVLCGNCHAKLHWAEDHPDEDAPPIG